MVSTGIQLSYSCITGNSNSHVFNSIVSNNAATCLGPGARGSCGFKGCQLYVARHDMLLSAANPLDHLSALPRIGPAHVWRVHTGEGGIRPPLLFHVRSTRPAVSVSVLRVLSLPTRQGIGLTQQKKFMSDDISSYKAISTNTGVYKDMVRFFSRKVLYLQVVEADWPTSIRKVYRFCAETTKPAVLKLGRIESHNRSSSRLLFGCYCPSCCCCQILGALRCCAIVARFTGGPKHLEALRPPVFGHEAAV